MRVCLCSGSYIDVAYRVATSTSYYVTCVVPGGGSYTWSKYNSDASLPHA